MLIAPRKKRGIYIFFWFSGEQMDNEAMILVLDYKEIDGQEKPVMIAFKHGLKEVKC